MKLSENHHQRKNQILIVQLASGINAKFIRELVSTDDAVEEFKNRAFLWITNSKGGMK